MVLFVGGCHHGQEDAIPIVFLNSVAYNKLEYVYMLSIYVAQLCLFWHTFSSANLST